MAAALLGRIGGSLPVTALARGAIRMRKPVIFEHVRKLQPLHSIRCYSDTIGSGSDAWVRVMQVTMRDVEDMEEELRARKQYAKSQSAEAYGSSDEEEGRGQQVRCAQQ